MANILAIRFGALGDVAIALPVLYSVAKNYPEHNFFLLTRKSYARMYVSPPANLHIIPVDLKEYDGVMGLNRLYSEYLKGLRIDAVADIHNVLRSWILDFRFMLRGVKVARREKSKADRARLLRKTNKDLTPLKPYYQRFADVFERLGYPVRWEFESLDVVVPNGFSSECKYIGVAPFSANAGKVYPLEKTKRVVELLSAIDGVKVLLFGGGAEERSVLEEWASEFENVESLAGRFSMQEELGIMKTLKVMFSMDSANMHLASLVGTPVASLWGPSHPAVGFRPWGQSADSYIQLDLPCRPCSEWGAKPCYRGDWACMKFEPEFIVNRIKSFL
ncbi:MAG: glycosyltransferase family 9 protein [Paludibacteraceae bacterium]|nr:glycosyltransferase family 9 protein [Paludibacteraceae bacterium]